MILNLILFYFLKSLSHPLYTNIIFPRICSLHNKAWGNWTCHILLTRPYNVMGFKNKPGGFTPLYRLNVCVAGYPPKFWTFGENISDFLVKIKKFAICFVFLRKNWKKNGKNWKKLNNYITNLIKIDKLWNNVLPKST